MDSQEQEAQLPQEPSQERPQDEPQVESQVQSDLEDDVDVNSLFEADFPEDEQEEADASASSVDRDRAADQREDGFKQAVGAMLRGGPGAADAARRVLMETGFSKSEADRFVESAGYESPQQQAPAPAETDKRLLEGLQEAQRRAEAAEERVKAVRAKQLEQEMDYKLYEAVSSPDVEGFIGKLDQLNEGEDSKSRNDRRQVLVQEIRRTALENLGNRTRRANRFDENWIGEEVNRASTQVMGRYRTAIGNIDRLGRSSVAVGPEEELRRSKPVSSPAWKPGKQASDMDTEIRDWTVDVLSRAALDGGTGESKL
jgi:hypothetical protein